MPPTRQQQQAPPFSKDEKVLCFHMDMLYEAKIMEVQLRNKPGEGYRFKVHYKGWKSTWDDWVLADRIRPFDDEHKELAAQLHAQLKHSLQKIAKQPKKNPRNGGESARGSEERASSAAQGPRGRRGKDWELEQHEFPVSNVRGAPEEAPVVRLPIVGSPTTLSDGSSSDPTCRNFGHSSYRIPRSRMSQKWTIINDKRYREVKDHLTELPKPDHRYVSASGKILFDSRYCMVSQAPPKVATLRSHKKENKSLPQPAVEEEPKVEVSWDSQSPPIERSRVSGNSRA
ncbi:hypothetical protein CP533_4324 [Ophiocordyceps camponoti-saundersi (nom. inval.)]|nr:hypothetical protein CP533_4324 [Ophiocordyceps camponoti-saundersi (nom. inval.)]